uniref:Uncharacterized protein LOC111113353 n=1 Tax=Crassostrea virginica TaxID=6565 RepID=A0A8B8BVF7_CRAVI|nr:uncharacterized protein LOC111113353 [Crassostrea virginica]
MGYHRFLLYVVTSLTIFQDIDGFLPAKCSGSDVVTCYNQTYINPKSFPASMVSLHVSASTIENLQHSLLRSFIQRCPNLKTFKITSSAIKYIHSCSFSSVSNLSQILIQDTSVKTIVQNAFSDIKSVQKIEFINVTIEEISKLAFHKVQNIDRFVMDRMRVESIRYASFAELENLKEFKLTNSNIQVMEQQPVANEMSISSLEISGNTINSQLCGLNSLFTSGLVFTNNSFICGPETETSALTLGNNRCISRVTQSCPPLKNTSMLIHSFDCQTVSPDEGIQPVSEEEVFDIDKKGKNFASSTLFDVGTAFRNVDIILAITLLNYI